MPRNCHVVSPCRQPLTKIPTACKNSRKVDKIGTREPVLVLSHNSDLGDLNVYTFFKFISHLELSLRKSLLVKISPTVLGNYSSLITWCRKRAGCIWGISKTFKESCMCELQEQQNPSESQVSSDSSEKSHVCVIDLF